MAEWVQEESAWLIRPPIFQMSPGVSHTRNPGELACAQGGLTLRPEQTRADFTLLGHILGFVSNSTCTNFIRKSHLLLHMNWNDNTFFQVVLCVFDILPNHIEQDRECKR